MKNNQKIILYFFVFGFLWCQNLLAIEPIQFIDKIQAYGDSCTDVTFQSYLKADESEARQLEKTYPILQYYKQAGDKVFNEMIARKVPQGQVYIWCLYNMGYVIKTPSVCFGIDLNHKYAARFAPYIDFLCITHKHDDHIDKTLNELMYRAGKPVVSNFFAPDSTYPYLVKEPCSMQIKGIKITTNINDHNSKLRNFVVTYQLDCGVDTHNIVIMHVGDSSFNPNQYSVDKPVDVLIPRYAPTIDYKIIGPVIQPKVILMSHIMELRHVNKPGSRSSIMQGLEHNQSFHQSKAYLPFWGELFVYSR